VVCSDAPIVAELWSFVQAVRPTSATTVATIERKQPNLTRMTRLLAAMLTQDRPQDLEL
jgi:hypothetical protein